MKNIKEVFNHLISTPQYSKLRDLNETKDFISMLGKNKNGIIHHAFCKNNTLFIAVLHPAFKQELSSDDNIFNIKILLKMYCKTHENSILQNVTEIKFIVANLQKENIKPPQKKDYSYLSKGDFVNLATISPIKEIFDKIKEELKNAYK